MKNIVKCTVISMITLLAFSASAQYTSDSSVVATSDGTATAGGTLGVQTYTNTGSFATTDIVKNASIAPLVVDAPGGVVGSNVVYNVNAGFDYAARSSSKLDGTGAPVLTNGPSSTTTNVESNLATHADVTYNAATDVTTGTISITTNPVTSVATATGTTPGGVADLKTSTQAINTTSALADSNILTINTTTPSITTTVGFNSLVSQAVNTTTIVDGLGNLTNSSNGAINSLATITHNGS